MAIREDFTQTDTAAQLQTNKFARQGIRMLPIRLVFLGPALLLLLFATERPALAYADPGSGALIWQMIAAGFVGAAFYFRRFFNWLQGKRNNSARKDRIASEQSPAKSHESEP